MSSQTTIHGTRSVPYPAAAVARSGGEAGRSHAALLVADFLWAVASTTAAHRESEGRSFGEVFA